MSMETTANTQDQLVRQVGSKKKHPRRHANVDEALGCEECQAKARAGLRRKKDILPTMGCKK